MILSQVHLREPCYDFLGLKEARFTRLSRRATLLHIFPVRIIHRAPHSTEATGGVYKGQGRNRRKLMICDYEEFLVKDK